MGQGARLGNSGEVHVGYETEWSGRDILNLNTRLVSRDPCDTFLPVGTVIASPSVASRSRFRRHDVETWRLRIGGKFLCCDIAVDWIASWSCIKTAAYLFISFHHSLFVQQKHLQTTQHHQQTPKTAIKMVRLSLFAVLVTAITSATAFSVTQACQCLFQDGSHCCVTVSCIKLWLYTTMILSETNKNGFLAQDWRLPSWVPEFWQEWCQVQRQWQVL